MVDLQRMHEDYEEDGLVVLGFNCADKKELALELLRQKSVTFRNILDSSREARNISFDEYKGSSVPLNYFIDREGRVAASFYGYRKDDPRVRAALEKLGIR